MAKKVVAFIKLHIPAGKATPAPPVGPALGQHGLNIMDFCKNYNAKTQKDAGLIIPVVILFFKKLRNIKTITFAGIIAILSLWLNRYLIVVPTLETPYMPIQDTRPEYLFYSATWVEWALTFAGFASFILMFILIVKFVPVIPMSGIIDNERELAKKQRAVDKEDSNNEKN